MTTYFLTEIGKILSNVVHCNIFLVKNSLQLWFESSVTFKFRGTSRNDKVLGENCLNAYIMIWDRHGTNVVTIHLLSESLTLVKINKKFGYHWSIIRDQWWPHIVYIPVLKKLGHLTKNVVPNKCGQHKTNVVIVHLLLESLTLVRCNKIEQEMWSPLISYKQTWCKLFQFVRHQIWKVSDIYQTCQHPVGPWFSVKKSVCYPCIYFNH